MSLIFKGKSTGSTMDASKIQITGAFEEYGFWVDYTAPQVLQSSEAARAHVRLFIGESKLGGDRPFISGIGQAAGQILKVQIKADRSKYFFIVVQREAEVYKYKLRRGNIMSPIPNVVLEIRPRIPGIRRLAAFWSILAPRVVDSRRALVATATSMMATDPQWYRAGLDFLRRTRQWEQRSGEPSSSTGTRAALSTTAPPEDPLTAPFEQCFAKVPYHPDFGVPRPITHSTYIPCSCLTVSLEIKYYRNDERKNSNTVLILNLDIIKDLLSYALADYSNEEAMELSHK